MILVANLETHRFPFPSDNTFSLTIMKLQVLSAPCPSPAVAFDELAKSAFQSSEKLAFLTVVVQSDSKMLSSPRLIPSRGTRSRRRASRRILEQKSAVNQSLLWMLNGLAWLDSIGKCGPWLCTVESSSLEKKYASCSKCEHKQENPDLFHVHAVISLPRSSSSYRQGNAPMLELEAQFGSFGNALCMPAGSHEESMQKLAGYVTKSDTKADALVSEVMHGQHQDGAVSRFFASTSFQKSTSTPWTSVATKQFPYAHSLHHFSGISNAVGNA